jgi:hypothetical protein
MPVILPKEGFEPWLAGSDPAVDPEIDAAVKITPVSPKMNKPSYNEPDCIAPIVAWGLNAITRQCLRGRDCGMIAISYSAA